MIGFDYLGLGHKDWPIKATINNTPEGSAIGFFDDVFGDPISNFKKLVKSGKFKVFRVHMHYGTNHKLIDIEQLKNRAALYERIAAAHPDITIYMSHTCEYNESNIDAIKKRIDAIKKHAPHCVPVNCKWRGASVPGIITEAHVSANSAGKAVLDVPNGAHFISTDGFSATQLDLNWLAQKTRKAQIVFFWASRFNLREVGSKQLPLPAPKGRWAVPSKEYIKAIVRLSKPEEDPPMPTFKGKIVPIESLILWKAFSEDKVDKLKKDDVRANKPLLISPAGKKDLDIVNMHGKRVGKLKYFGQFPVTKRKKYQRHYSGTGSNLWGYEIADRAKKSSGSECVWVKDGNIFYGVIYPARRNGYY